MDFYLATLSVILMASIHSGASEDTIKCYSCSSESSPECAEGNTNKLKQFITECNLTEIRFGSEDKLNKVICMKLDYIDEYSNKTLIVQRGCSTPLSAAYVCEFGKIMDQRYTNISCNLCDGNLCNGAMPKAPSMFFFVISLISCLLLIKQ